MKKRMLIISLLLVAMLASASLASAQPMPRNYRAHLTAVQNPAAPIEKNPQGQAIFQFNEAGDAIHYQLIVANIDDVLMAHIHIASEPGGSGGVVVWLYPHDGPPPALIQGDFNGVLAQGTITASDLTGELAGGSLEDLRTAMNDSLAYVMVHTEENPGGEIRGFIH
jgi:hypothetical protein